MIALLAAAIVAFAGAPAADYSPAPLPHATPVAVVPSPARWMLQTDHLGVPRPGLFATLKITSDGRYVYEPRGEGPICLRANGTVSTPAAFDIAVQLAWSEPWAQRYENLHIIDGYFLRVRIVGYDDQGNVVAEKSAHIENPQRSGGAARPPALHSLEVLTRPYSICRRAPETSVPARAP